MRREHKDLTGVTDEALNRYISKHPPGTAEHINGQRERDRRDRKPAWHETARKWAVFFLLFLGTVAALWSGR